MSYLEEQSVSNSITNCVRNFHSDTSFFLGGSCAKNITPNLFSLAQLLSFLGGIDA